MEAFRYGGQVSKCQIPPKKTARTIPQREVLLVLFEFGKRGPEELIRVSIVNDRAS